MITTESHCLVVDSEGNPEVKNNMVMLQAIDDSTFVYTPLNDQIKEMFGLYTEPEFVEVEPNDTSSTNTEPEPKPEPELEQPTGRKFFWKHESTLAMLQEYRKRKAQFRDPECKKIQLWADISQAMKQRGFNASKEVLDKKMRNMKATYRVILNNVNRKLYSDTSQIKWPYYNIFQDIFKEDKTFHVNTTFLHSTKNKRSKLKGRELINKKYGIDIEEEKLNELRKIREALERSNELQEERLNILERLVESKREIL